MINKIIIDLDGVVYDTISRIVEMYNYDHIMYKDFKVVMPSEIKTWEFTELTLEPPEVIDKYFCTPRFFTDLPLMKSATWIINKLSNDYQIIFCSSGAYPNLQLKREWVRNHFKYAEFIPVELPTYKDKSAVNMKNSIFIDDVSNNLTTSNADVKICFGEVYSWNEDWDGIRCKDWEEVYQYIKEYELNGED